MDRNRNGSRLWMKGFPERSDDGSGSMRYNRRIDNNIQRRVYYEPHRRNKPKKRGATGFGFRLKVTVCPKLDQLFLAFATVLLIVSLDLLVLTFVNVGPGMLSRKFTPATCTVVSKSINASSYCYVATLKDHGKILQFPCLQIHVTVDSQIDDIIIPTTTSSGSQSTVAFDTTTTHIDDVTKSVTSQTQETFNSITTYSNSTKTLMLYQNEFHLIGGDYIHRPCSFLPGYCSGNSRDIAWNVFNYSKAIGNIGNSTSCHFSDSSGFQIGANGVVIKNREVKVSDMIHAILWPFMGIIVSILCCTIFWKKNHYRAHRMFIYNAWSPS